MGDEEWQRGVPPATGSHELDHLQASEEEGQRDYMIEFKVSAGAGRGSLSSNLSSSIRDDNVTSSKYIDLYKASHEFPQQNSPEPPVDRTVEGPC